MPGLKLQYENFLKPGRDEVLSSHSHKHPVMGPLTWTENNPVGSEMNELPRERYESRGVSPGHPREGRQPAPGAPQSQAASCANIFINRELVFVTSHPKITAILWIIVPHKICKALTAHQISTGAQSSEQQFMCGSPREAALQRILQEHLWRPCC